MVWYGNPLEPQQIAELSELTFLQVVREALSTATTIGKKTRPVQVVNFRNVPGHDEKVTTRAAKLCG